MNETLSKRQLNLLIDVSNVLNSSLSIDKIFQSIMKETINAIDAADGGVLFLYNKEEDALIAKSSQGFDPMIIENVKLKPGESMTGLAFLAKSCLLFPTQDQVRKTVLSMSEKNIEYMELSMEHYPYAAICAPIIRNGKGIGVITIDCFQKDGQFTQEDMDLLEAIAHQAAVALEKANLYRVQQQQFRELKELNNRIVEQNLMLQRSIELHNQLSDLVLEGEGLDSILQYINEQIGYPAILFDEIGEIVALSKHEWFSEELIDSLEKEVQLSWQAFNRHQTFVFSSQSVKSKKIVAFPVGSKQRLLGGLVIVSEQTVPELEIAALSHACTVVSLMLLKNQAVFDTEQALRGEFIDVILSGNMDEAFYQRAKHLHFQQNDFHVALIINFQEQKIDAKKWPTFERYLLQVIQRYIDEYVKNGMVVAKHDNITAILSFDEKLGNAHIRTTINTLIHHVKEYIQSRDWSIVPIVGVGRSFQGLKQIKKTLNEATKCLQFMKGYDLTTEILNYQDLGAQRLLLQNSKEELRDFIHETLEPLLQYDCQKQSDLFATLVVYLDHNKNIKNAAQSLHIHLNTLSYRLKRIYSILDIDPEDSQSMLDLHLSVNIYRYLNQ
ncbi:helix-turn-helix domain-containing protein [Halalkalibacterium ligniniphilum]|uniref:helix-turn-helix domain-containing protein n=1 Tax=Halalkalibacterium ligniniphilum TaxID=1134413 RepID=UPI00034ACCC3|nr:helix-turn-helix domain-containing protein [Halalkalibacterium ligniniphilum]